MSTTMFSQQASSSAGKIPRSMSNWQRQHPHVPQIIMPSVPRTRAREDTATDDEGDATDVEGDNGPAGQSASRDTISRKRSAERRTQSPAASTNRPQSSNTSPHVLPSHSKPRTIPLPLESSSTFSLNEVSDDVNHLPAVASSSHWNVSNDFPPKQPVTSFASSSMPPFPPLQCPPDDMYSAAFLDEPMVMNEVIPNPIFVERPVITRDLSVEMLPPSPSPCMNDTPFENTHYPPSHSYNQQFGYFPSQSSNHNSNAFAPIANEAGNHVLFDVGMAAPQDFGIQNQSWAQPLNENAHSFPSFNACVQFPAFGDVQVQEPLFFAQLGIQPQEQSCSIPLPLFNQAAPPVNYSTNHFVSPAYGSSFTQPEPYIQPPNAINPWFTQEGTQLMDSSLSEYPHPSGNDILNESHQFQVNDAFSGCHSNKEMLSDTPPLTPAEPTTDEDTPPETPWWAEVARIKEEARKRPPPARVICPLPTRVAKLSTQRRMAPVRGSEEDLKERLEIERRAEARMLKKKQRREERAKAEISRPRPAKRRKLSKDKPVPTPDVLPVVVTQRPPSPSKSTRVRPKPPAHKSERMCPNVGDFLNSLTWPSWLL